ncbi:WRNexo [Scenedesmus sp. PABB004]|nr:WRNexo [Scenedesmus sp. PABB004]
MLAARRGSTRALRCPQASAAGRAGPPPGQQQRSGSLAAAGPPPGQQQQEQQQQVQQQQPKRGKRAAGGAAPARPAAKRPAAQQAQRGARGGDDGLRLVPAPFQGQRGPLEFRGELRYATTPAAAARWLDELLALADSAPAPVVVGYDTESKVDFQDPRPQPTSLLQLCWHPPGRRKPVCLLLPVGRLGLCRRVLRVLGHKSIIKAGIGLAHDMLDLQREYPAAGAPGALQCLIDLSWLANSSACAMPKPLAPPAAARQREMAARSIRTFDAPEAWGLAALLGATSEFTLTKVNRITRSNWSRMPLEPAQIAYAAADAAAGLIIFRSLQLRWLQVQHAAAGGGLGALVGSGGAERLAAAAAARQRAAAQQQAAAPEGREGLAFTLEADQLTDPGLWEQGPALAPARALAPRWRDEVLRPGFQATAAQLARMLQNAEDRAEAGEATGLGGAAEGGALFSLRPVQGAWGEHA